MFEVYCELGVAGVAVRRRAAVLGVGVGARRVPAARLALPVPLARALLVRRRRVPAAPACAAAPRRRAAAVPRLVAGAGAALAAVAAVAPVGGRVDALVAAPRLRPQLRPVPELGRRLVPDAAVAVPPALAAAGAALAAHRAFHTVESASHTAPRPAPRRLRAAAAAARGLAREPLVVEWLRQQECVLVAAQPEQPHRQPGGVAAAAVPAAAAGAAAAAGLGRGGGRGLGGRALRVGPCDAHAHALDAGAHARAAAARRRGGEGARHEGGVPGVPQAAGAAPALAGAAGRAAAVSAGHAVAARAPRAPRRARPRARRNRLLTSRPLVAAPYFYLSYQRRNVEYDLANDHVSDYKSEEINHFSLTSPRKECTYVANLGPTHPHRILYYFINIVLSAHSKI